MIEQLPSAVRSFTSSVKTLGAITVAFFLLLGFLIYLEASMFIQGQAEQAQLGAQLDRVERKIDTLTTEAKQGSDLQGYFLRKICENVARSESDKIGCNPPPFQQQ